MTRHSDAALDSGPSAAVSPPVILMIGPPGAGKSTVVRAILAKAAGASHFGVRAFFDRQIELDTPLGRRAAEHRRQSPWLPRSLIAEAVADWVGDAVRSRATAMVIEGYPWDSAQAVDLDRLLGRQGLSVKMLIFVDVPDKTVFARTQGRRVCTTCETPVVDGVPLVDEKCDECGNVLVLRTDDDPRILGVRLTHFREASNELVRHYSGKVRRYDGRQPRSVLRSAVVTSVTSMLG